MFDRNTSKIGSMAVVTFMIISAVFAGAAAATLLLPIAFIVFPDTIGSFFKSADLWGLVYVVVLTSGQAALGWML